MFVADPCFFPVDARERGGFRASGPRCLAFVLVPIWEGFEPAREGILSPRVQLGCRAVDGPSLRRIAHGAARLRAKSGQCSTGRVVTKALQEHVFVQAAAAAAGYSPSACRGARAFFLARLKVALSLRWGLGTCKGFNRCV